MKGENHFEALVRSSEDAIVSKNLDGIVLSWNPAAERLFGFSPEEIIGTPVRRLLPPERQCEEDLILARIRNGEKVGLIYTRRLHKDGRLLPVSLTISPIIDDSGTIVGASKIARDATDYFESETRLSESERNFETLANTISQLAWMAEPDGGLTWYNHRWYEYTGTTFDEMRGWGWQQVHHPEHLARVSESYRRCLESGEEWDDTFPLRRHDGTWRWFLSRAKPIRDEHGQIVRWFGTNTDITDQREQGEQIKLLLLEVRHRAKNMLGTVMALARRSAGTAEGAAPFLERFDKRLMSMASNLDVLVRRDWKEVPVAELIDAQLGFLRDARGTVQAEGPDAHVTPRAAETIGMALHELGTNALKYGALSRDGGKVAISWRLEPGAGSDGAPALVLTWEESGGPPVNPPERIGFGTTLLRDMPARSLGAVTLDYHLGGIRWELRCRPDALAPRTT